MKLRKTGFEVLPSFVIRLVVPEFSGELLPKENGARHRPTEIVLGISYIFDEFPNQLWCGKIFCHLRCFGKVGASALPFDFITQIYAFLF